MNKQKLEVRNKYLKIALFSMFLFSSKMFAAEISSDLIINDVSAQNYLSDDDKKAEIAKRTNVQNAQNFGINAGLYLQNLPTAGSSPGPGIPAPVNPFLNIVNAHFKNPGFCDQGAQNEGGNGFGSCQADPALAHGDIKISTLLTGSKYTDTQLKAAQAFVENLVDPFPSDKLQNPVIMTQGLLDSNPELQQEVAKALVEQAALSVARQPFVEMIAKRTGAGANNETIMQRMEREAGQRFLNPQWQNSIATAYAAALKNNPQQAVFYDMVALQAYQTWLEFERYKQNERMEALLSGILQQLVSASRKTEEIMKQGKTLQPTTNPTPPNR